MVLHVCVRRYSSSGNELSHEFGHSYGLGHYPGGDFSEPVTNDKVRQAVLSLGH